MPLIFCIFCCSLLTEDQSCDVWWVSDLSDLNSHWIGYRDPSPSCIKLLRLSPSLSLWWLHLCVMDGEQKRTSVALPASGSVFAYDCDSHCLVPGLGRPLETGLPSSSSSSSSFFHCHPPPPPSSGSSGLSVRRLGLLRVRPVKLLHSHRPPVCRPAPR